MYAEAPISDEYIPGLLIFNSDGKEYTLEDITSPTCNLKTGEEDCEAFSCFEAGFQMGNFHVMLDILDPDGVGFNDNTIVTVGGIDESLGFFRRIVLCQVLTDISHLIRTSKDICTGEEVPTLLLRVQSYSDQDDSALAFATPFYYNFTNLTQAEIDAGQTPSPVHPDILYNSIWRYLNGGTDPFNFPWINFNQGLTNNVYHGALDVNFTQLSNGAEGFYYDLTEDDPVINGQRDFYTVMLHEAFHLLGFTSLIQEKEEGLQGAGDGTLFTRYDTYIRDGTPNGEFALDINEEQCYDIALNTDMLENILNKPDCHLVFDGTWTEPFIPVLTSGNVTARLSHLSDECYGQPSPFFIMGPSYQGFNRTPTKEEVSMLCDLGYSTTGKFGDGMMASHKEYEESFKCGDDIIAGVDDPCNEERQFEVCVNQALTINIKEGLWADDQNVDLDQIVDCLFVEQGDGVISISSDGDFITYTPGNQIGFHVLSYRAEGSGEIVNTTFIYVWVTSCNVTPCFGGGTPSCNVICNPNMNSNATCGTAFNPSVSFSPPMCFCPAFTGWDCLFGSPTYNDVPNINPPQVGFNYIRGYVSNSISPFVAGSPIYGESMRTDASIAEGVEYLVSFYKRTGTPMGQNGSNPLVGFEMGFTNNQPNLFGNPVNNTPSFLEGNSYQTVYSEVSSSANWEKIVLCVKADHAYNNVYFIPSMSSNLFLGCPNFCDNDFLLSHVEAIQDVFPIGETKMYDCDQTTPVELGAHLCDEMDCLQYTWEFTNDVEEVNGVFQVKPNAVWSPLTTGPLPDVPSLALVTPTFTTAYRLNRVFAIDPALEINLVKVDGSADCTVDKSVEYIVVVPGDCCPDQASVDTGFNLNDGNQLCFGTGDLPFTLIPNVPGGAFDGEGVNGTVFNPTSVGKYTITYTITNMPVGCEYMESVEVEVIDAPNANFTSPLYHICSSTKPFPLMPVESGGVWSSDNGATITNGFFIPLGLAEGVYNVTYTINNGICPPVSTTQQITVQATPSADFNVLSSTYCANDDAVALTPVVSGGVFAGGGGGLIYDDGDWSFDPSAVNSAAWGVTIPIHYLVSENGCSNISTQSITVFGIPDATFTGFNDEGLYCEDDDVVTLNGAGTFTGNGISGNQFNPSIAGVGVHTIVHTVTNEHNCTGTETLEVEVMNCCPEVIEENTNREEVDCCLKSEDDNDNLIDPTDIAEGVFYEGDNFRYVVKSSGTWTSTANELETVFGDFDNAIKVNVDLVIPRGIEVNMTSIQIKFGPEGRIIVEPGGVLNLNGNTILTSLCNSMWQGIRVLGPGVKGKRIFDENGEKNYGVLKVDGIRIQIEHALIGVAGMQIPLYDPEAIPIFSTEDFNDFSGMLFFNLYDTADPNFLSTMEGTSGGVCMILDGNFDNCFVGVNLSFFLNLSPEPFEKEISVVTDAFFEHTTLASGDNFLYPFQAIEDFTSTEVGVELWFYEDLFVKHNVFEDLRIGVKGLYSRDITCSENNQFDDCAVGVSFKDFSVGLTKPANVVRDNTFEACETSIQTQSAKIEILHNVINANTSLEGTTFLETIGLFLNGSHFDVTDQNQINNVSIGTVLISNSDQSSGRIRGNSYHTNMVDVWSLGDNNGVQVSCNEFDGYLVAMLFNDYTFGTVNQVGMFDDQGNCSGAVQNPADNQFLNPFQPSSLTDIFSNITDGFTYHHRSGVDFEPSVNNPFTILTNLCGGPPNPHVNCEEPELLSDNEILAISDEKEKDKAAQAKVNYYLENDQEAKAVALLENLQTTMSKRWLVSYYIEEEQFAAANSLLSQWNTSTLKEQQFKSLQQIYRNLKEDDRSLKEINVFERTIIREMAKTYTRYGLEAQNILAFVYGESHAIPLPPIPSEIDIHRNSVQKHAEVTASHFSALYPNPSKEMVYLDYYLPASIKGTVQIFDMNGRLVLTRSMNGTGKLRINVKDLSSGIYFYQLSIDNVVEDRGKLMITY